MAFIEFPKWIWSRDCANLLRVSILEVHAFKELMVEQHAARCQCEARGRFCSFCSRDILHKVFVCVIFILFKYQHERDEYV
jgi:hypothetical protein